MPDKKLTDAEIIKALNNLLTHNAIAKSGDEYITIGDVVDLINRLQAENERLYGDIMTYRLRWAKATAKLDIVKAEAYKEFADKLKEKLEHFSLEKENFVSEENIDNLLKELVGDDDG